MTWLGLFITLFAVFCVWAFWRARIAPGIEQLREWDRENGA
jgi:hypothetical protein